MADVAVFRSMQALLTCAQEQMLLNPNPPQHYQLRAGLDPTAANFDEYRDYCCEGLVYVKSVRMFPAGNNFPVRDEVANNCAPAAVAAELELGAFRCVPSENSMDADAWELSVLNIQNDADAMFKAICCWTQNEEANNQYFMNFQVRDWFPFSNQGGCAGGAISVTGQYQLCTNC